MAAATASRPKHHVHGSQEMVQAALGSRFSMLQVEEEDDASSTSSTATFIEEAK